ncbi:DUF4350 domain-containing protein [Fodinicola acaciae]|uniref:DUF4350 domain-containing protein n=1 Tax=Fodinicola acaciae TaxID=2681555 RepID=UPI0013D24689|nr:DUF4350 domain-containing protein [Fodinicola acaciae]
MTTTLAPPPPPGQLKDPSAGAATGRAWRWARLPLLIVVVLVLGASIVFLIDVSSSEVGTLNPRSYRPEGANALRVITEKYGTPVRTHDDSASALEAARAGDDTLFVSSTEPLALRTIRALGSLPASTRVVLAEPDPQALQALLPRLTFRDDLPEPPVSPKCSAPEATAAGPAGIQSRGYDASELTNATVTSCYDGGVLLVTRPTGPQYVLIADAEILTNRHLAENGNAALGVNLLSTHDRVDWLYLDESETAPAGDADSQPLFPRWVTVAFVYLLVAGGLAALWRARRLGTPVPEPLPVVVRSAETVEGRARLYRKARARQLAAASLRGGALARVTPGLGLGPDPDQRALAIALAERIGRPGRGVDELQLLFYGSSPTDDQGLVALATDLDQAVDDYLANLTAGRTGRGTTAEGTPQ